MDDLKYIIKELQETREDIKEIQEDLVDIKVIQGKNQVILQEHMRRTEANEKQINEQKQFKWYFAGLTVIITTVSNFFRGLF